MNATSERWYLSQDPWFKGDYIGTMVLCGSADPHGALVIVDTLLSLYQDDADLDEVFRDRSSRVEHARAVARRIVDLHNAALDGIDLDATDPGARFYFSRDDAYPDSTR